MNTGSTSTCLLGTTSLLKDDVYDSAGKFLGEIEEIVLDSRTGCVRYAVLALGGFLGIGQKRFAVPWSAITPDADYQRCIVNVTVMRLMSVPVSQDDPWLQRAKGTRRNENELLLQEQALLDVTPPKRRSAFLKPWSTA